MQEFPSPRSVKDVRQFLGLASFYRKFVPSFAKISHSLTRKNAHVTWIEECQQAFNLLKQKLIESPVLADPNFGNSFILETDASCSG